jgi:hypothetical protein
VRVCVNVHGPCEYGSGVDAGAGCDTVHDCLGAYQPWSNPKTVSGSDHTREDGMTAAVAVGGGVSCPCCHHDRNPLSGSVSGRIPWDVEHHGSPSEKDRARRCGRDHGSCARSSCRYCLAYQGRGMVAGCCCAWVGGGGLDSCSLR